MSVLLLNMPFSQLCWPNLGLSLLKTALTSRDIDCDLSNPCFLLAKRTGHELYDWVAAHLAFVLGGEQLFARHYFQDEIPSIDEYWKNVLLRIEPELDFSDRRDFQTVADAINPFLDDCMARYDWSKYRMVGFTTSFQQTLASLSLAQRIKSAYPEIQIVFGGAACEGEMGQELLRCFNILDFVFVGESDLTFPKVVREFLDGSLQELPEGVLSRHYPTQCPVVAPVEPQHGLELSLPARTAGQLEAADLDQLPLPDFDDYFSDLADYPDRNQIRPLLFFETSRGCWWGERRQCAFCGLNGHSLKFRCKNPTKAVDDLTRLVERYGTRDICFSDNIFAKEYFDTFLPQLKSSGLNLRFEFEMKANQKKEQVRKLLDAGLVAAQLGIETLSTPILKMLSKGATARHNLQVLKWYTEGGAHLKWNILYGFPGEDPAEYNALTQLLPLIYHFHPPTAIGRVRVDRFAPYHHDPTRFGIKNLRPFQGFQYIYPFDEPSLKRLAYYHDFDFEDDRNPEEYVLPFLETAAAWEDEYSRGTLRAFDRPDGVLLLTDTRPIAVEFQFGLKNVFRDLYLFCDTARKIEEIEQHFGTMRPNGIDLEKTLEDWVQCKIMLPVDNRFFALALNPIA